jgi:hypothetical protein
MKNITNRTRVIFLAVLAGLISFIYVFSQNKNTVLTSSETNAILSSQANKTTSDTLTSDEQSQKNYKQQPELNYGAMSNKNLLADKSSPVDQTKILKTSSNAMLAADAQPPQPLPEGQEIKPSRQHQNMPPPAPDSKYAVDHQHTNRPDIGTVEKH